MVRRTALFLFLSTLQAAAGNRLLRTIDFAGLAPEDLAMDTSGREPTYWVTSHLDSAIYHYDAAWKLLETVSVTFLPRLTGIAYNSARDTLLLVNPLVSPGDIQTGRPARVEIYEIDKGGNFTGTVLELSLDPVLNPGGRPFVRGIAYVPESDFLDASVLLYESVGAKLYCFALDGTRLFSTVHVDDPDGYPGTGSGVQGGGILPVLAADGRLAGLEFTGYEGNDYVIRSIEITDSLQALYRGHYIPLEGVSGQAAGFERGRDKDPEGGADIDVFYLAVDTQHKIFVFRTDPLPLYEPFDFACASDGDAVRMEWKDGDPYDRIVVRRDGSQRAVLSGAATSYSDEAVPPGDHRYELWGEKEGLKSRAIACEAVIGPGQVLSRTRMGGRSTGDFTVGPDGLFWITDPRGLKILRYDSVNATFEDPIAIPLVPTEENPLWPARIACDRGGGLVYLIETYEDTLYTFDPALSQVEEPVALDLTGDEEIEIYIGSVAFSPAGDGGRGSLLLLEANEAKIYELTRQGQVLRSFRHPDWFRDPPPEGSPYGPAAFGLAIPPAGGTESLDIVGGTMWDRDPTRILRVRTSDGVPTGYEIPLSGIALFSGSTYVSFLWREERLFALNVFELGGVLYEFRTEGSVPPPPSDLVCLQGSLDDVVSISFRNNGPYERIAVERDGASIAELGGEATGCEDAGASPGIHTYAITAFAGGRPLRLLKCKLRVGTGAELSHKALWPPVGLEAVAEDPAGGSYFLSSVANNERNLIFHVDAGGRLLERIPAPYDWPWQIAAIAVTPRGQGRAITTIGWCVGGSFGDRYPILLTHQSESGAILEGPKEFKPPIMPREPYVLFPASLHWDRAGGFWFLERNASIMWHINWNGDPIEHFEHPAPASEQFVYATATAFCPERGVFYLSTDRPGAHTVTHLVECTIDGLLTGYELPLDAAGLSTIKATLAGGSHLEVFGFRYSLPARVTCKAFDAAPGVKGLKAALDERRPRLTWEVEGAADRIVVERNGISAAALPGTDRSFLDETPAVKARNLYVVRAEAGTRHGPHAAVSIFVPPPESSFLRGDSNNSGRLNIADAVYTLVYLFTAGPAPLCLDAADVDDDGAVRINDPVYLLGWLFAGGPEPPAPFPTDGLDTTPDGLTCWK